MASPALRAAQQAPQMARYAASGARRAMDAYRDRDRYSTEFEEESQPSKGGRRSREGQAEGGREALVRPSRKNVDRSRGSYAAVGQTDSRGRPSTDSARNSAHTDSDPERSPNGSSDGEHSEDLEKGKSTSRSSRGRKGGVATGGSARSDDEHDDREKKGSSWTKWALIGGLVVLLIVAIGVHKKSSSSTATPSSAAESATSGSSSATSATTNATAASAVSADSSLNSTATDAGGASGGTAALTPSASLPASSAAVDGSLTTQVFATGEAGLPVQVGGSTGAPTPTDDAFASTPAMTFATAHAGGATGSADSNGIGQFSNPDSQMPDDSSQSPGHDRGSRPTASSRPSYEGQPGWQTTSGAASTEGSTKFTTTATWFAIDEHRTACGTTYTSSSLVAALPPALYGSDGDSVSALCGAKMNVWSPDSNVTISVKVGDVCNACPTTTSIDLSQAAFLRLAGASPKNRDAALDKGVLSIQWWLEDAGLQAQLPIGFSDWDGSVGESNEGARR
ncbi:expansin family protein [Rhodotorula toruloides NP11]|uniref:Expansin family protein n=1 Tax=Rhodotorula toruloides (strain NP11) TaxID=1130832 RepID=M7XDM6_RHOT1|nr:expansin family protein [Rhodotorula toruloides NP11]EMS18208.1 expansin family protein [Rhodotorula toruloides NP11]